MFGRPFGSFLLKSITAEIKSVVESSLTDRRRQGLDGTKTQRIGYTRRRLFGSVSGRGFDSRRLQWGRFDSLGKMLFLAVYCLHVPCFLERIRN